MTCDIALVILWEIPEKKAFRCLKTQYKHTWILFAEVIYATVKMLRGIHAIKQFYA